MPHLNAKTQRLIDLLWPVAVVILLPLILGELWNLHRKNKREMEKPQGLFLN
jgi:hypothetical protein